MAAYAALLSLAQTTDPNATQNESLFSSDAEEKVRSIHDYVDFLILFFEDYPQKVNRWEVRIRDLAYKIKDIIDFFLWQRIRLRQTGMHPSCIRFEDQLKKVTKELGRITGEVMEERPTYLPPSSPSSRPPVTSGNDAVIGLDKEILAIQERLCGQSSDLQVIPIVGMGGIGKTTLARTVYNDQLIMESFDIRAWVVVSQDYSPLRFRKMLLDSMKLLEEQMSGDVIDESKIESKVYKTFKGMRYLVVIDDVWGTDFWDDVRDMFPDDHNGSRIMLTTRLADVGAYVNPGGHVHEMKFMDESRSWDLLRQKVFTDGCCPPEMEEVGKGIAVRCGGLPLAVVLVAGVLSAANVNQDSWEKIAENLYRGVDRDLGPILSLSYTYLPHHLRSCFLFIGGFQKDVNIRTSRLIRLWAAEGFQKMEEICKKGFEDKAEEYLEDLVKRNLVVVTSRKIDGKIKSCSLHDIVRDLCISKAHEEKFLRVMDQPDLPQVLMNERRISFSRSHVGNVLCPTLHTILCSQIQKVPSWLALLGEYKLLWVLDALGVNLTEFPSNVFELYHLRYLALMGSFSIPPAVSNLVNLQTLTIHLEFGNLRGRYVGVVPHSLPMEIWKLRQLRHLFFHAPYMLPHPPEGLNLPLQYIQTLLLIADFVWDETILQLIPNVKRLGLTYTGNQDYHLHHLKDLHQLEKLEVIGYPAFSWRVGNPCFPRSLKKLTLVGGGFPWKDMGIVGSLPNLEFLILLDNACDGETWETTNGEFPRLKLLLINESNLLEWTAESDSFPTLERLVLRSCQYLRNIPEDSFPRLKRLVLCSCPLLMEIPEGIGEIPTLELIEVDDCAKSLLESAEEIKEQQADCGNDLPHVRVGHEDQDVAYEIEDIDDKLMLQRIQRHPSSVNLEDQLEYLKEEIGVIAGEVRDKHSTYLPRSSSSSSRLASTSSYERPTYLPVVSSSSSRLASTSSYERPTYLPVVSSSSSRLASTGNDDNIMAIEKLLSARGLHDDLEVITIVGMGGIGKTTLARTFYDDQRINKRFYIRAWTVVSQDYNPHKFWKNLLDSMKLFEEEMFGDEIDESEIGLKVYQTLKGRKYLVVIDDVWGTHFLKDVRHMFPNDINGSRILLTTRQFDVAVYPSSAGHVHEMRFMNDSQIWNLLKQKVFTDGRCPPELEDVGKEIARRCAGLPFAVFLVAEVLSPVNKTRASWEEIVENVNSIVDKEFEDILLLSYTCLPHHLRPCFLFLGGFLENVNICSSRLARLWVAEGFLEHENISYKSLEEKAEEYLEDLVRRHLVVVTRRKSNGKIKSCALHDMVRRMCIKKAEEEKFLHIMDGCDLPQGLMNERCISFICSDTDRILGTTFRTILCFQIENVPSWLALLGSYKLVRILDALGVDLKELPAKVFELYHLRYLALKGSFDIPSDVSNLVNLQTLIIHTAFGKLKGRTDQDVLHSLPVEIWRLLQLRHLVFHAPYMLPHPSQGLNHPLQNLQTLSLVANLVWNEKILEMIPNVKRLGLTYTSNEDYHLHHLKDLHQLEKLEVIGYPACSWRVENPSFPSKLKKLTLVRGGFPWKDMGIVGSLPNLEVLKLLDNACAGETWETTNGEFPRLKLLLINESNLLEWTSESDSFPSLERLVLCSCHRLRNIPEDSFPRLKRLVLRFCQSLREIPEDSFPGLERLMLSFCPLLKEIPEDIGEIPTLDLIEVDYCSKSLVESANKIKEQQEDYGNDFLQVRVGHEDPMDNSSSW